MAKPMQGFNSMQGSREIPTTDPRAFRGGQVATSAQRMNRLRGMGEGYLSSVMDLPMRGMEALAPDAGYTPGELRSSPKDRARGQRYAWEDYQQGQAQNPDYAAGMDLGEDIALVADPFFDIPLAGAAKMAPHVAKALKSETLGADAMQGMRGLLGGERGAVGDVAEDALIAQHNLSLANLEHAEKMGGIPVPSLAINKVSSPLQGFGEITLVADKNMIDPRGGTGAKVFGADVYSPRYPSIDYKTSHKNEQALKDSLAVHEEEIGATWSDYPDIADRGRDSIENSALSMADFLKAKGEKIPKVRDTDLQGNKTKKIDRYGTKEKMRKKILSKYPEEFQDYIDQTMYAVVDEERLFQGFTYSGNRKYKPHTLANVTAQMKKDIRGGEGFNYGPGSLRAQFTPEFKSIKQIKDNSGRLVTKDVFNGMKDEISDDMYKLYGDLEPYMKHKNDNEFMNYDQFQAQISEVASMGVNRTISEYFPDAPREGLANFVSKLADYPTEYFESNILRSVDIGEFSAAVVPTGTPQKVIDRLKKKGLKVKKYKKGDESARQQVMEKLKNLHFSVLPAVMIAEDNQ